MVETSPKSVIPEKSIQDRLRALAENLKQYKWNVFVDGPADAGKGTACELFMEYLGLEKIETGKMYRAIVVWMKKQNNLTNTLGEANYLPSELAESLGGIKIDFRKDEKGEEQVLIGQKDKMLDVTREIELDWVNQRISGIAKQDIVRDLVEEWQAKILKKGNKVIEGRDMWQFMRKKGVKKGILVYIYASDEELARREVERKGQQKVPGAYEKALVAITQRNSEDNQRNRGQLLKPDQARQKGKYDEVIDTSKLSREEVLLKIMEVMERKIEKKKNKFF